MEKLALWLESSVLFRWTTGAAGWIDRQWEKSLLSRLLTGGGQEDRSDGLVPRFFDWLHGLLCALFRGLRLDRVFEGSVFSKPFLWCGLTVLAAPLVPTMMALGLVMGSIASLLVCVGRDRTFRLPASPVNKWICLFAMVYLVCTFTSVTPRGSLNGGMLSVAFILFSIVLQGAITERKQIDRLIQLLVAGGFLVSMVGFAQVILGVTSTTTWLDDSFVESGMSLRVYATLDNPNVLSEYLLLIIPLAVVMACTAETRQKRAAAGVATAAMLACMVLTYSRAGWLALLVSAALFLVLLDRRFIVLGLAGLVCLLILMPDTILTRFASILNFADTSSSYRISIWMGTISMLRDYWFCGIGPGTEAFNTIYPLYSYNAANAQHSHNLYLQLMVECGVLGLVTFLGGMLSFIRTVGGKLKRTGDKKTRLQCIALICGVVGFLIQSMGEHSFYNYRVELVFWTVIALGIVLARNWKAGERPV